MPGTTPQMGWSYPNPSDLIAQGADTIKDGLTDVEDNFFRTANAFASTTPYTDYPTGMMLFTNNGGDGWPYTYGQVLTIKRTSSNAWQWFYAYTGNSEGQRAYLRIGWTSAGTPTWSAWQVVASAGTSEEEATGSVTIVPTAGVPTPVNVSFPSNRFTKNPRVFLQYQGTKPQDVMLSTDNRTTTGFRAYVYRTGATSVTFHYYAVVMASDIPDN